MSHPREQTDRDLDEDLFDFAGVVMLYVAYNLSYAVLSYPAGVVSDRRSRRLVFGTWTKATPGVSQPWIATIDPGTGRAKGITRLPLPSPMTEIIW